MYICQKWKTEFHIFAQFRETWISEKPRRTHDDCTRLTFDLTICALSFYVSFFVCARMSIAMSKWRYCECSKLYLLMRSTLGRPGLFRYVIYTGKIKRKMLRAAHVVLELFMSQMLTVQNLSVTSKISCKAKPKVVPFFHFPRRPPYYGTGWLCIYKYSLLDVRD